MTGENTVYICVPGSKSNPIYHTYHDCPPVKRAENTKQTTEAEAKTRGYQLCGRCDGESKQGMANEVYQAAVNADVDVFE